MDGSYFGIIKKDGIEITVRVIEYQIRGFRPARLITTILDPMISARELVIHYHQRWDIEIAFDEIKTHQCATLRGHAPTVLRSKRPNLVTQDLYAVMIVYNLVRQLIYKSVGGNLQEIPRISFLETLQCIIDAIPNMIGVTKQEAQKKLTYLLSLISECEIDRPRRNRLNPRVVKVKMSKFARKRETDTSDYRDFEKDLEIIGLDTT